MFMLRQKVIMKVVSKITFSAAIVALFISQSVAQQSAKGLKDTYANYFRIGTCYPYQQISNTQLQDVILREFNSITHENDLKPEATMVQNGSTNNDIKVQLNSNARAVMTFAQTNNIPIRGHTLVWHQQTPDWFFWANMQSGNNQSLATKEVMNKRMESYIKNIFNLIKTEFKDLNLYAYDVVNEMFLDSGKPRDPGDPSTNSDQSTWVKIYGNNSFADSAFVYARKYAPADCKLFYNDFNEYHPDGKADSIVAFYNRLKTKTENGKPVIDGIGMQSHLSTNWPPISTYNTALTKFVGTGAEIHVTELDIEKESGATDATQAELYESVFKSLKEAREKGANITSVSVWGVRDDWSWRSGKTPLLFSGDNYTKKPAYNSVSALIPEKNWGNGTNPQFNVPDYEEVTADENGFYFYHDFENASTTSGWSRRGDNVTVENTAAQKNSGLRALYVNGRNQNWNGANFTLPSYFEGGKAYSFSVMVRPSTAGSVSLSYQYNNAAGTESYGNVATVTAAANEWTQVANVSCTLPEDGTNFLIYVEAEDANANFYVDDAMGGLPGATLNPDGTPGQKPSSSSRASSSSSSSRISSSSSSGTSSSSSGISSSSSRSSSSIGGSSSSEDNSPIRLVNSFSKVDFRVSSLNGSLQIESRSNAEIYLYDINGNKVLNFNVPAGESIIRMSLPPGIYIVKNEGIKKTQKILIK
nr:xylanase precursor [uncultured bacterium]